jgi:hypothetical protein
MFLPDAKNIKVLGVFDGYFAACEHPKFLLCESREANPALLS